MAIEASITLLRTVIQTLVTVVTTWAVSTLSDIFQTGLVSLSVGTKWAHIWISGASWAVMTSRTLLWIFRANVRVTRACTHGTNIRLIHNSLKPILIAFLGGVSNTDVAIEAWWASVASGETLDWCVGAAWTWQLFTTDTVVARSANSTASIIVWLSYFST